MRSSTSTPTLPFTWTFAGKALAVGELIPATMSGTPTRRVEKISSLTTDWELAIETADVSCVRFAGKSPVRVEVKALSVKPGVTVRVMSVDGGPGGEPGATSLVWSFNVMATDASGKVLERVLVVATPDGPARVMYLRPE